MRSHLGWFRDIRARERCNYRAGMLIIREEKRGKWRGTLQSTSTRMFLGVLEEEGETGRTPLLSFSIAAALCSLPEGSMICGWECTGRLMPSRTHLADISSNSVFSGFTQHFLSVSKQTDNNSNFLHLAKRKQTKKWRHSFLPISPSTDKVSLAFFGGFTG